MLHALLLTLALHARQTPMIERDAYGVPHVQAATLEEAFFDAGYAVAQDRLWQMETSRRIARGRMAEVFGPSFVASDREVLQTGYTDEELQTQLDHLSPRVRSAFRDYTRGVNAWIEEAKKSGLPAGYASNGFAPEPWSELDSAAIAVRLLQLFGRGGAGEIRNMALLSYLANQPKTKTRILDVFDDFLWLNDPGATPTVSAKDDLVKVRPDFYFPDRDATKQHVAMLPKLGLLEMLPAIRMAEREESSHVAQQFAAPYETGSYCVIVDAQKSATGRPLLLSGPQMGFRNPSIVHEMSISAPGLSVVGMDIPGAPGVVVGYNRDVAWGLTSGVADTDDIFFYPLDGDGYRYGDEHRDLQRISRTLKVKGGADQTVVQTRTVDGPVILRSNGAKVVFARKSSYWMRELESVEALDNVWRTTTPSDAGRAMERATMNFNFFCVGSRTGDEGGIVYRYAGLVPLRATGIDPRLPTPGGPKFAWRGLIPPEQMPHAENPSSHLLANWNNKPVGWWPNGDTPVWGTVFRNRVLLDSVPKSPDSQDLELTAWSIARLDDTWPYFKPYYERAIKLALAAKPDADLTAAVGFDGCLLNGSRQAATYLEFFKALRSEIFLGTTGNFLSPDFFSIVAQPAVMLKALERRTKVDYVGSRLDDILRHSLEKALEGAETGGVPRRYAAEGINITGQPPIPYSNRGTYIQVVEALPDGMAGQNILPPGLAETGPHAQDQVPLSRAWLYKPMARPWLH